MTLLHFGQRGRFQLVDQVVGLHADDPLRPLTSTYGFFASSADNSYPSSAAHRGVKRHNLVRQMNRMIGFLRMPKRPHARRHHLLRIRLSRIDHVVDLPPPARRSAARQDRLCVKSWPRLLRPSGVFGHFV